MRMTVVALLASVSMTSVLPVNAHAAPAPRSAGPPRALTVGSRTAPLGIDDPTPDFAWQLDDARKGAVQSAFRILGARTATTNPSSASVLWDSGRVASSQLSKAKGRVPTEHGDITVAWERKTRSAGLLTLRVTIPPNSTATVRMPNRNGGGTAVDIGSGSYNFRAGS